jgi:hypothetical protein
MTTHLPHPVPQELVARKIPVRLVAADYEVGDFYKSGTVTLRPAYDQDPIIGFTAIDRYGAETGISDWDDLVRLHHDWWLRSRNRGSTWEQPAAN